MVVLPGIQFLFARRCNGNSALHDPFAIPVTDVLPGKTGWVIKTDVSAFFSVEEKPKQYYLQL
jgi:hypothetical protein